MGWIFPVGLPPEDGTPPSRGVALDEAAAEEEEEEEEEEEDEAAAVADDCGEGDGEEEAVLDDEDEEEAEGADALAARLLLSLVLAEEFVPLDRLTTFMILGSMNRGGEEEGLWEPTPPPPLPPPPPPPLLLSPPRLGFRRIFISQAIHRMKKKWRVRMKFHPRRCQ